MNKFAFSNGLRRLFGFSAVVAVALAMLVLSGCGHRCRCQKSGCNTCNTCGVSDNSTPSNNVCTTCQTGNSNTSSTYDRVGTAPASLSEPIVTQTQPSTYASQPAYTGTSTSLQRPGESQELPMFSKPMAQPIATETPANAFSTPAQPPAAVILKDQQAQNGAGQYHTLAQGETIYALGRRYGVKPKTILDANHFNDPNHLSVGTKVYIPAN